MAYWSFLSCYFQIQAILFRQVLLLLLVLDFNQELYTHDTGLHFNSFLVYQSIGQTSHVEHISIKDII